MIKEHYQDCLKYYEKFGKGEDFRAVFYSLQFPMPYKDLTLYPVKTYNYMVFHTLAQVFFKHKYDAGLPECMGMNHLQFLMYENPSKGIFNAQQYVPQLTLLLQMCLHWEDTNEAGKERIKFVKDGKKCYIYFDDKRYDWQDFENIKTIICEQNCIELPDYTIHPDIRRKLEEKEKLLAKINKNKVGSFEELVDSLMIVSGFSEDYIHDLTIRRFTNLLRRYEIVSTYELGTLLSPNMEKKDRESILSWNSPIPKNNQFTDKVQKLSDLENQIKKINGQ